MAPGGSTGQGPTVVPGGITGYSHQAHYPQVSSSASLHCAHIFLFLFLFHFSTTYLCLLVACRVSECLRLSQERSRKCNVMVPGRGHLRHGLLLPGPAQHRTDGHLSLLRIAPCPGRPHSAGQVAVLGLFLTWSHELTVTPLKGSSVSGSLSPGARGLR